MMGRRIEERVKEKIAYLKKEEKEPEKIPGHTFATSRVERRTRKTKERDMTPWLSLSFLLCVHYTSAWDARSQWHTSRESWFCVSWNFILSLYQSVSRVSERKKRRYDEMFCLFSNSRWNTVRSLLTTALQFPDPTRDRRGIWSENIFFPYIPSCLNRVGRGFFFLPGNQRRVRVYQGSKSRIDAGGGVAEHMKSRQQQLVLCVCRNMASADVYTHTTATLGTKEELEEEIETED